MYPQCLCHLVRPAGCCTEEAALRSALAAALDALAAKQRQLNELLCDRLVTNLDAAAQRRQQPSRPPSRAPSLPGASSLPAAAAAPVSPGASRAASSAAGEGMRGAFSKMLSAGLPAGLQPPVLPSLPFQRGSYEPPAPVLDGAGAAVAGPGSSLPAVNPNVLGNIGQRMTGAVSGLRGSLFGAPKAPPPPPAPP